MSPATTVNFRAFPSAPKRNPAPLATTYGPLLSSAPSQPQSSIRLCRHACSGHFTQMESHSVCSFTVSISHFDVISFQWSIPVIARISSSISVDCQTRNSMWLSQLSIHPMMEIWVVSTAAMNNAAVNTDLHVSVWACFYFPVADSILRVSRLTSPFSCLCSDCPFCRYSFFSSWAVLRLFRPAAQSLLLQTFPDCPALRQPFLFSPVIQSVKSSLALHFTLLSFFPWGRILSKYTLV